MFFALLGTAKATVVVEKLIQLQQNSSGEFRMKPQNEEQWVDYPVYVTTEAASSIAMTGVQKAVFSRGDTIPTGIYKLNRFVAMSGFFTARVVDRYTEGVVCTNGIVVHVGPCKGKEYYVFAKFVLVVIISILFMMISNILFYKKSKINYRIFSVISTILAFIAMISFLSLAIYILGIITLFIVFVVSLLLSLAGSMAIKQKPKYLFIAYYVLMALFFVELFIL